MGDPAVESPSRPRGRPAASLTPPLSVSVICWGARVVHPGMMCENPHNVGPTLLQQAKANWLRLLARTSAGVAHNYPEMIASWFALLRLQIFQERLCASRVRFAAARP